MTTRPLFSLLLLVACGGVTAPRETPPNPEPTVETTNVATQIDFADVEPIALSTITLGLEQSVTADELDELVAEARSGAAGRAEQDAAECWQRAQTGAPMSGDDCVPRPPPRTLAFCEDAVVSLEAPTISSCAEWPEDAVLTTADQRVPVTTEAHLWSRISENVDATCERAASIVSFRFEGEGLGLRGATESVLLAGGLAGLFLSVSQQDGVVTFAVARRDERGAIVGTATPPAYCWEDDREAPAREVCESVPSLVDVSFDRATRRLAISWAQVNGLHCGDDVPHHDVFVVPEGALAALLAR